MDYLVVITITKIHIIIVRFMDLTGGFIIVEDGLVKNDQLPVEWTVNAQDK